MNFEGWCSDNIELAQAEIYSPNELVDRKFDIEAYASRYSGFNKLQRLLFIARMSSVPTKLETYKVLIEECRKGSNTIMYATACQGIASLEDNVVVCDNDWIQNTNQKSKMKLDQLESDLANAKSAMIKETIRICYMELADFYYQRGSLQEAMKNYTKARDHCSTARLGVELCLHIISVANDMGSIRHMTSHLTKAESTETNDPITKSKMKVAAAIIALFESQYKIAAKKLLEIDGDLTNTPGSMLSAEDIATYGTLLAFLSLDRQEIRKSLLESNKFKIYMDASPSMRSITLDYFSGNYASFLSRIFDLRSQLLLDYHMRKHIDIILQLIKDKYLIQYFSPYNTVSIEHMANSFGMTMNELEGNVSRLISKDLLPARIDSRNKTIHRRKYDDRNITIHKILKVSRRHVDAMRRSILYLSLQRNNFQVVSQREIQSSGNTSDNSSVPNSNTYLSESKSSFVSLTSRDDMLDIDRHYSDVQNQAILTTSSDAVGRMLEKGSSGIEVTHSHDESAGSATIMSTTLIDTLPDVTLADGGDGSAPMQLQVGGDDGEETEGDCDEDGDGDGEFDMAV